MSHDDRHDSQDDDQSGSGSEDQDDRTEKSSDAEGEEEQEQHGGRASRSRSRKQASSKRQRHKRKNKSRTPTKDSNRSSKRSKEASEESPSKSPERTASPTTAKNARARVNKQKESTTELPSVTDVVNMKNLETMVRNAIRVTDLADGKMGSVAFVEKPKSGDAYVHIAKRVLLQLPGIGQLGDDIVQWLAELVTFENQKKKIPRGTCIFKKYEKIRSDLMRTMRGWITLANMEDLSECRSDLLRLGAGYKNTSWDLDRIRHIALNLDLLKKTPCSAAFYPPAPSSKNGGSIAPKLASLAECQKKATEMHSEFEAYDGLVAALLGETPMNDFAKKGDNMGLVAQVSTHILAV